VHLHDAFVFFEFLVQLTQYLEKLPMNLLLNMTMHSSWFHKYLISEKKKDTYLYLDTFSIMLNIFIDKFLSVIWIGFICWIIENILNSLLRNNFNNSASTRLIERRHQSNSTLDQVYNFFRRPSFLFFSRFNNIRCYETCINKIRLECATSRWIMLYLKKTFSFSFRYFRFLVKSNSIWQNLLTSFWHVLLK